MGWTGVITDVGAAALATWQTTPGCTLSIVEAQVGSGHVETADMHSALALVDSTPKTAQIARQKSSGTMMTIAVKVSPAPVGASAYVLTEVGLFARLDNGEKFLLALHQHESVDPEGADAIGIPSASDIPDFVLTLYLTHNIGTGGTLTIEIDPTAHVSVQGLDDALTSLIAPNYDPLVTYASNAGVIIPSTGRFAVAPDFENQMTMADFLKIIRDAQLADQATLASHTTQISGLQSADTSFDTRCTAIESTLAGKAPKGHASTGTTYGAGSSSNYGHVKLSDATNSSSGVSAGIAATPKAVKSAYDLAKEKAPKSHAATATTYGAGDASNYGHVKLSDTRSADYPASKGVAATPKAVQSLYNTVHDAKKHSVDYKAYVSAEAITISANSAKNILMSSFTGVDELYGGTYTLLGLVGVTAGNAGLVVSSIYRPTSAAKNVLTLRNVTSSAITIAKGKMSITVLRRQSVNVI